MAALDGSLMIDLSPINETSTGQWVSDGEVSTFVFEQKDGDWIADSGGKVVRRNPLLVRSTP